MSAYTFSIRSDVPRNVMYLDQHGRPSAADLLDLKRAYVAEIEKLREGYVLVNDQRDMEPYDDEAMEVAKELVEITNRHRASRVIRIVPVDLLSTIRLSETLIEAKSRYPSIRVTSPEEAEEALAELSGDLYD